MGAALASNVMEFAAGMRPAVGQLDITVLLPVEQTVVTGITVHLQDTVKTLHFCRVFTTTPWRIPSRSCKHALPVGG